MFLAQLPHDVQMRLFSDYLFVIFNTKFASHFQFQKIVKNKKQKRSMKSSLELKDLPELNEIEPISETNNSNMVVDELHKTPLDNPSEVHTQGADTMHNLVHVGGEESLEEPDGPATTTIQHLTI